MASDHASFIGVVTNLVLASGLALTSDRRATWPWPGQVAFWGTNLGLVVFLIGLAGGVTILKQVGAPVMGVSLLVALALLLVRLRSSSLEVAEA